jgi:hypothetical protein
VNGTIRDEVNRVIKTLTSNGASKARHDEAIKAFEQCDSGFQDCLLAQFLYDPSTENFESRTYFLGCSRILMCLNNFKICAGNINTDA